MFRAMLWKEVREQAAILIALLVLGSGVIAVAAALGSTTGLEAGLSDFRAYTNAGRLAVLALTIAAGVVIGASLFAGEIENETMVCLELLPARRWKIWWGKLAAGAVMAVASGTILLTMGSMLGALGSSANRNWVVAGAILMLVAFGWGTFGSTISRNTLGACAAGLLGAIVFGVPIFSIVHAVLLSATRALAHDAPDLWLQWEPVFAAYAAVLAPIAIGGVIFTAPDRARLLRSSSASSAPLKPIVSGEPGRWRALTWLAYRQGAVVMLIGSSLALLAGLTALLDEVQLLVVWPTIACLSGVCGGVFAWADEQSQTTFRYWSESRLPLGRPWVVKIFASGIQSTVWILLLFLPVFIRSLSIETQTPRFVHAFGEGILGYQYSDILAYQLVWPLYGFAFGHLAGLLFRKTVVAIGVGLLTAAPIAAFWLPSLLTGGIHHWQLWPVPLCVLLSTRILLRPWSADRLVSLRPIICLLILVLAGTGWTAFGLGWRVLEVPVTAEIDEDVIFAESVPQLDSDDGGRHFRQAVGSGFSQYFEDGDSRRPVRRVRDPETITVDRETLHRVTDELWPSGDLRALAPWLESEPVVHTALELQVAAGKPPGPIENPRVLVRTTEPRESREIRPAVEMLLARGLLWQRRGQPEEFVVCLDAALAVTRNARVQQPSVIYAMGLGAELPIWNALDLWLAGVTDRPDLVRRALGILKRHHRECPREIRTAYITDRMIDRNTLQAIGQWAPKELELRFGGQPELNANTPAKQKADIESELASFAVVVPWERERFRRILGVKNGNDRSRENRLRTNTWFGQYIIAPRTLPLDAAALRSEADLQVSLAQVALTLHVMETGRAVRRWEELVPDLLESVPRDPYNGQPLGYRISAGERIRIGTYPPKNNPVPGAPLMPMAFEWELHGSLAALVGGLGYTDLPPPRAPGVGADGVPTVDLDFVGAVAGGVVQWPLERFPSDNDGTRIAASAGIGTGPNGEGIERVAEGTRAIDWSIKWLQLVPGRGIVWSIGPDRTDDRGEVRAGIYVDRLRETGDLLRIVPVAERK